MIRFLHSRYFMALTALVVVACALVYAVIGDVVYPAGDGGFVRGWGGPWLERGHVGMWVGLALTLGLAVFIGTLNRTFNLLRSMTWLHGAFFLMLTLATPSLMLNFYPGLLLAATVMLGCFLMFVSYNDRMAQRQVFLTFLLLSAGAALDYSFVVYMPVFWLATAQMRIFSMRSFVASLMGIATPWIILLGFRIVDISDLQVPHFYASNTLLGARSITWMIGVGVFSAFLGVSAWIQSAIKILSYNAQSRAMLSVITVVLFFTLVFGAADYRHLAVFLPLLNCSVALQEGHLFSVIYRRQKSYYAILAILIIYLGLFAWRTILCVS